MKFIGPEAEAQLSWQGVTKAIAAGHQRPRAEIADSFLHRGGDTMLTRCAWIDGLGALVKTAMVMPGKQDVLQGSAAIYDDTNGAPQAVLDFGLLTKWKTVGDSLLGAERLAPPEVREILIVGAGTVGGQLREAYGTLFPQAQFTVWNRTLPRAVALSGLWPDTRATDALESAVRNADLITCATMSAEPVIQGDWLRPGQHLDLIGAFKADMREADDTALRRGRLFVDSRATTIDHIGELKDPIARGVITPADVIADYYDLNQFRRAPEDITIFKNGGGAHLDLMVADYIRAQAG